MFRPSITLLAVAVALVQLVAGIDVSENKSVQLEFSEKDALPQTQLKTLAAERANAFIGDLTIGRRYADETVFRRVVEFNNPTSMVQRTTLNLTVNNGIIHYVSVQNDPGSYAVVCDEQSSLGSPRSSINLRVSPNSKSSLTLIIAAH